MGHRITSNHLISQGDTSITFPSAETAIYPQASGSAFTNGSFYNTVCGKSGAVGTIKQNGCAICSLAMFVLNKGALDRTNNNIYYAVKEVTVKGTNNSADITYQNFNARVSGKYICVDITSTSNFESAIKNGMICLLRLKEGSNSHYVLADGYDYSKSNLLDACLVADPDGGVYRTLRQVMSRRGFTQSTAVIAGKYILT